MKLLLTAAFAAVAATTAWAQGPDQETLKKNYEKKLSAEFLKKATWITDYDKAREAAKESGKPIFAYFSRSYAN